MTPVMNSAEPQNGRPYLRARRHLAGGLLATACALAAGHAHAQAVAATASDGIPAADHASIVTLQDENASISTNKLTDRYYVNGLRASYTSPTDITGAWLQNFGDALWGAGRQRFSIDVEQGMFTPDFTNLSTPAPNDRPYAGTITITGSLIHDTLDTRSLINLTLGWQGPASGARELQNGFHGAIGQGTDAGWHDQLRNEPLGQALVGRTWRFGLGNLGPIEFDALPAVTAAAGNWRTYAEGAAVFRVGQGLGSDFGVSRQQPGVSGSDAYTPTRPIAWYLFAGGDGQAVAVDSTFDTEDAPYYTNVAMIHDVGEFEGGAAVLLYGVRVTYTQVFQTHEFVGQRGGLHQFGSLAAAVRF